MPPVVDIPRARKRILQKDVKLVEFAHRRWSAALQEGQTLDDALVPEFWSDAPRGITAGDVIEVRTFDHSFFAEIYVRKVEPGSATVMLIRSTDFVDRKAEAKAEAAPAAVLTTRWNPGRQCFEVIRSSDKEIVSTGYKLKEDAKAWIDTHLRALKAA